MSDSTPVTLDLPSAPWPRRGRSEAESAGFTAGSVIDHKLQVVRPIGRGGMGRVVEVVNLTDGNHLALKYCDGTPLERKRLVREARMLAALDHPHLLPVLEANLAHHPPYFVMPLARASLESELRRHSGDLAWSTGVFRQVCLGVQALHEAGVVHRDLKPANVLLMPDNRYVVADLGTAKREPRDMTVLTRTCAVLGTLSYLAPEQLLPGGSRQADVRTDVYQLGKIFYEMITGRTPVVVDPAALPGALARIILRASANCPSERYGTVIELLQSIEAHAANSGLDRREAEARVIERVSSQLKRLASTPSRLGSLRAELLDALAGLERLDADEALDAFDGLPSEVLAALAREDPERFLPPLRAYVKAVEQTAARRDFAYADRLAARVRTLVHVSPAPEITAWALEALLIAAVTLNRYSAMAVLRSLLYEIRRADVALVVAERLRAAGDYLREIAANLRRDRLHPTLRAVVDELEWIETVTF
jgi:serine/threonine protein kinase